jgi:hypothetical protein
MREPSDQIKIGNYSYTYAYNINGNRYSIAEGGFLFNRFYYESANETTQQNQQQEVHKAPYNPSTVMYPNESTSSTKKKKSQDHYAPEVAKAIDGINYVCEHLKKEDLEKMVDFGFRVYEIVLISVILFWSKGERTMEICSSGY